MSLKDLANWLRERGFHLEGCREDEIQAFKDYLGVHDLPGEYLEFLRQMGKGAGPFMEGSSVFYDEIFDLNRSAELLLRENNFRTLPDQSVVFWMHQGYQFAFFKLDEGDNPPIYFYYEGKSSADFEIKERSLIDFLIKQLEMS